MNSNSLLGMKTGWVTLGQMLSLTPEKGHTMADHSWKFCQENYSDLCRQFLGDKTDSMHTTFEKTLCMTYYLYLTMVWICPRKPASLHDIVLSYRYPTCENNYIALCCTVIKETFSFFFQVCSKAASRCTMDFIIHYLGQKSDSFVRVPNSIQK